ncbi:MAG: polysaccharide deacetylase family protein [Gammaproteobacteria bacterium]
MHSASAPVVRARPVLRWRWLRWNLHHLTLAYIVVATVGMFLFGWPWWALALPGAALVWLVADGMLRPSSNLFYPTVSHGARSAGCVALTFDDGPDPAVTPLVLDELARYRAHATFFVIGKALAAQPDLARRMLAEGHAIGNHSWQHSRWQNFRLFRWQLRELEHGEQALAALQGGQRLLLYRPPVGLKRPELVRAVWQRGLTLVAWSLHSRDTFARDPVRIARRVLGKIRAGDIVLLHDGHDLGGRREHCVEAVHLILDGLHARGERCVTVPELLQIFPGSKPPVA